MNSLTSDALNVLAKRNPSSPVQSLLWKCWRLTRTKIALQILITSALLYVMFLFMEDGRTYADRSRVLTGMALMSSACLYFSLYGLSYRPSTGAFTNFGFPLFLDYHHPISTPVLIAVPLCYLCAMVTMSFVLPLGLLSLFIDIASPQPVMIFIVVQAVLVVSAINWWTSNVTLSNLLWIPVGLAVWYTSWLVPAYGVVQETREYIVESPVVFVVPVLLTGALLLLMGFGVQYQRSGGLSLNLGLQEVENNIDANLRDALPFLKSKCPTDSPLRAEIWREMQARGLHTALSYGGLLGGGILIMMVFMVTRVADTGFQSAQLSQIVILSIISLSMASLVYLSKVFGATSVNGQMQIGVFDRTRALGTVPLASIKLGVAVLGLLVMTFTMFLFIAIFGGVVLDNMPEMRASVWDFFRFVFSWPIADTLYYGLLLLTQLIVGIIVYTSFSTWCMLKPKVMGSIAFSITAYCLALWVPAVVLAEDGGIGAQYLSFLTKSLWVIVVVVPAFIVYLVQALLKDCVLSRMQMVALVAVCLSLGMMMFQTLTLFGEPVVEISLLAKSLARVGCLLPLTAALLAPWTMSWVRHA